MLVATTVPAERAALVPVRAMVWGVAAETPLRPSARLAVWGDAPEAVVGV